MTELEEAEKQWRDAVTTATIEANKFLKQNSFTTATWQKYQEKMEPFQESIREKYFKYLSLLKKEDCIFEAHESCKQWSKQWISLNEISLNEFKEICACHGFIDSDGSATLAIDGKETTLSISPSDVISENFPKNIVFNSVFWYNK